LTELESFWFPISVIFSIISGILIIFLLAIQSWVLMKVLPEIKTVSKNAETVGKLTPQNFLKSTESKKLNISSICDNASIYHIHNSKCFQ